MERIRTDKEFISVEELAMILGVSKSMAYEYIRSEHCPFTVVKIKNAM